MAMRLPPHRSLSEPHGGVRITHRLSINSPLGHFYSCIQAPGDNVVPAQSRCRDKEGKTV